MRSRDGKVGMYQALRRGAFLDSEFFPESFARRSWPNGEAYAGFLASRKVDFVVIYRLYDERHRTNEHALLDSLSCATRIEQDVDFDAYAVSACGPRP